MKESIKQKSLIIEHLYTDCNYNQTKMYINDSSDTSRTQNKLQLMNKDERKNIDFDNKSCNTAFSTNTTKKKGFVGFFQNIFK